MNTTLISNPLTPVYPESCVFVEQPLLSARCADCKKTVKTGDSPTGEKVFLNIPYQIRSVNITDGRSFEKVSTYFRHNCEMAVAA